MNSYESMIVISANLQDSDVEQVNLNITEFIKSIGGEMTETDAWGKKTLAYEIMKQKEGYYFINYFKLAADKILELDRQYRLNESIIRYNIIKK
ncbi:MAG: 30S ribosomal protein S6 [Candidatus Cloacimonetes bacterium]|nr:30S ribosomal protein S6 [Candidatus Cloacimonadota bacterium]